MAKKIKAITNEQRRALATEILTFVEEWDQARDPELPADLDYAVATEIEHARWEHACRALESQGLLHLGKPALIQAYLFVAPESAQPCLSQTGDKASPWLRLPLLSQSVPFGIWAHADLDNEGGPPARTAIVQLRGNADAVPRLLELAPQAYLAIVQSEVLNTHVMRYGLYPSSRAALHSLDDCQQLALLLVSLCWGWAKDKEETRGLGITKKIRIEGHPSVYGFESSSLADDSARHVIAEARRPSRYAALLGYDYSPNDHWSLPVYRSGIGWRMEAFPTFDVFRIAADVLLLLADGSGLPPDLISQKTAASKLGCSRGTIIAKIDAGVLTPHGPLRQISLSELYAKREQVLLRKRKRAKSALLKWNSTGADQKGVQ